MQEERKKMKWWEKAMQEVSVKINVKLKTQGKKHKKNISTKQSYKK